MAKYQLFRIHNTSQGDNWTLVRHCLSSSLLPGVPLDEEVLANIMDSIEVGRAQAWSFLRIEEDRKELCAVAVTTFVDDTTSGIRNLLLYSLTSFLPLKNEEWKEAFDLLGQFAKGADCYAVVAYTANPRILDLIKLLGGSAEYRYAEIKLFGGNN